jgi:hypothetical protein
MVVASDIVDVVLHILLQVVQQYSSEVYLCGRYGSGFRPEKFSGFYWIDFLLAFRIIKLDLLHDDSSPTISTRQTDLVTPNAIDLCDRHVPTSLRRVDLHASRV